MAISSYTALLGSVQTFLYNAGTINASAADVFTYAESILNMKLRCREMETTTDLSPTSGVFTLPTDYAWWKEVVELNTQRQPLIYIAKEKADKLYPTRPSGVPFHFSITGTSLRAYPTTSNDIELTYYQRLDLATDVTNWLLSRYPIVYLTACQMVAADLIKDQAEEAKAATKLQTFVEMLNDQDSANEWAHATMQLEQYI